MNSIDPANILVICIIIGFTSFVIYVSVEGHKEEKKNKSKKENKE